MRKLVIVLVILLLSIFLVSPAFGQSALEELAKRRISESTGLDPDLLATLFVTDGDNQFILAFVYINERTLQSKLKPELKAAITPFVNRKAILVLVAPTKRSFFSPAFISFTQDWVRYSVHPEDVTKITADFRAGILEKGVVSAGIVLLNRDININRPFEISYKGHTTTFALNVTPPNPRELQGFSLFLQFILLWILTLFLIPFLI